MVPVWSPCTVTTGARNYSRPSLIQIALYQQLLKSVQISEFVRITERMYHQSEDSIFLMSEIVERPIPYSSEHSIDLIHGTIFDYVIHFRMAKAHERPYATVCKAVSKEA